MPSFYRRTRHSTRRPGRNPWAQAVSRRERERTDARALAALVAADAPEVTDGTPEEYGVRWVFLRQRRDTLEAQRREASRQMDELGREGAEAFSEAGVTTVTVGMPNGERYHVRIDRQVYPKYLPRAERNDDGQLDPNDKYGQADLIAALVADGYVAPSALPETAKGGIVHTTVHGGQYNKLIRKLDKGGEGVLPEALGRIVEFEPAYGLAATKARASSSQGEPPTDDQ